MSTAMDEVAATTTSPRKPRSNKLRIPLSKQHVVSAMLSEQIPHRKIHEATGIATATIQKIKRQETASNEEVERIKKGLRNRFAAIADRSLTSLDDTKLAEASAKDLIYIASKATEIALGGQSSVVETYTQSLKAYLTDETPQPVVGPGEIVKTVTITKTGDT